MSIFDIRRRNLRRLIQMNFDDNQSLFARTINRSESYVNRLLAQTDNEHGKNLGEKLARDIESRLRIDPGWFDQQEADLPEWKAAVQKTVHLSAPGEADTDTSVKAELIRISADLANISARLAGVLSRV